jgi:hypothetical protein
VRVIATLPQTFAFNTESPEKTLFETQYKATLAFEYQRLKTGSGSGADPDIVSIVSYAQGSMIVTSDVRTDSISTADQLVASLEANPATVFSPSRGFNTTRFGSVSSVSSTIVGQTSSTTSDSKDDTTPIIIGCVVGGVVLLVGVGVFIGYFMRENNAKFGQRDHDSTTNIETAL